MNEVYDVRKGVDSITSPRASHAIVKGRMRERTALTIAGTAFALAIVVGIVLVALRGPAIIALGVLGLIGGWGYRRRRSSTRTAPSACRSCSC